jgi:hypothetical protein
MDIKTAAEQRAAEIATLPAPFGAILGAIEAGERLNAARFRHVQDVTDQVIQLHVENGELRDELLRLAAALVRAGIPLDLSPTLRGVL